VSAPPIQLDTHVPPAPTPTAIVVSQANTQPGAPSLIQLTICTLTGVTIVFHPVDEAEALGRAIMTVAQRARSKLIIAGPNLLTQRNIPPNGNRADA
jgi:hypothetical protein